MVKAPQKGVVNGQNMLKNMENADDRSQCGMVGLLCKNNSLQFVTRTLLGRLGSSSKLKNCKAVKGQRPNMSAVNSQSAEKSFDPRSQLCLQREL